MRHVRRWAWAAEMALLRWPWRRGDDAPSRQERGVPSETWMAALGSMSDERQRPLTAIIHDHEGRAAALFGSATVFATPVPARLEA